MVIRRADDKKRRDDNGKERQDEKVCVRNGEMIMLIKHIFHNKTRHKKKKSTKITQAFKSET